jgi:Tetracyclin repressor-like, C-terminal domain
VLWREVVEQTNAAIVSAGRARAQGETGLLSRLSAYFTAAMQAESEDRSAAAFLVTSVLESQRHPELSGEEDDSLKNSREFVAWAVNDAIKRGELSTDTDVTSLVEMLVAVMWGMGFYAGFVGTHEELKAVVDNFEMLMANKLWQLRD